MYTAFNATQSIFLHQAGPHAYPLFFIVLALAVWPMVALQGWLVRRIGIGSTFRLILAANAIVAVDVYVAYSLRENATVAFAAYVVYSVAFELVMLSFWSFVTQHFNVLEGKRIFPVIAAGSSIGYILAAPTTTIVAVYATEPLTFVWSFGCAAAAVLSLGLEKTLFRPAFVDDADQFLAEHEVERHRRGTFAVLRAAMSYLAGNRLVVALVLLALVLQVSSRVGDYLVAVLFVAATHNNLQSLTILIGNAWLLSYVVQLVVSLVIAPVVMSRLGVRNAILILPVFLLFGFAAVVVSPILATALVLFVIRNGLQTGLDDPAENVLAGALPAQVVPRLNFLLGNLVLPGAALLTGVGLLVVQRTVAASVEVLAVMGFLVSIFFIAAAVRVRGLYLDAIYARLRTHAISLADFQQAVGRPTIEQITELRSYIRTGDDKTKEFAAAALARSSPSAFASMVPELLESGDPLLRRMAFRMAPPDAIRVSQLESAGAEDDGWVRAAAAVAGVMRRQRWEGADEILRSLRDASLPGDRAAAAWAAAFTADFETVVNSMRDPEPRVRLEAIRSFAKLKGDVPEVAAELIGSMTDPDLEVRRAAIGQAVRWTAPPEWQQRFAEALADGLASGDHDVRRLSAEAMAAQAPEALALALPLLLERDETSAAAVEALMRSGRPELFRRVRSHLEVHLAGGVELAQMSARVSAAMTRVDGDVAAGYALLRIGLDDYVHGAASSGLAAMRALHGKRGFATVETGLASEHEHARGEALETLLNFGPRWLATPLVRLLEPESFDLVRVRPLSEAELEALASHPDRWVRETAEAALHGFSEHMKELIALKRVPLFSTLTLEQLESVDRLMVTRHYLKGEPIFRKGDPGSELFVVVEGEVRIHLDGDGREVTLARHGSGSVVGEMSVFDEQPRSAGAQASVDTTVRVLRRDRLHAIVHEHPEVLLEFVKNLSQRLRETNEKLQASAPPALGATSP